MALINPKQYIISARSNGYKDTAYAIAELTDNSIQAEADNVKVVIFENNKRTIDKIAIADNGNGMTSEMLSVALGFGESGRDKDNEGNLQNEDKNGMGKFGMGLPNASVSQCKRVEVWSWKNKSDLYYTYLDVDEIIAGTYDELPPPVKQSLPDLYLNAAYENILPESGTFVLWSVLDKLKWKRSKTLFDKSEFEIGRMYRYFLFEDKCKVQFKVFDANGNFKSNALEGDGFIKPNDPLYLMPNSSLPALPDMHQDELQTCFVELDCQDIRVTYKGNEYSIKIKTSIARNEVLKRMLDSSNETSVGNTLWGRHCARNIGLSVMRAGRELELNSREFFAKGEVYQIRWSGIEIEIPTSLDEVFGVTNNKQHANNLKNFSDVKIFDDNNIELTNIEQIKEYLIQDGDEESAILYSVSKAINDSMSKLRGKIKKTLDLNKVKSSDTSLEPNDKAELALTGLYVERNKQNPGKTLSKPVDYDSLRELLVDGYSYSKDDAQKVIDKMSKLKSIVSIQYRTNSNNAFFDVDSVQGITVLNINPEHGLYKNFLSKMNEHDQFIFNIILGAWARLEDEAYTEFHQRNYEKARNAWGDMIENTFQQIDLGEESDQVDEL